MIDRLISYFAPETALKRAVARKKMDAINTGYSHHGASGTKKSMIGWSHSAGSPDDDITLNLDVLRPRARDLYMGNPIACGALKTDKTNVVGSGLKLNPQIDADFLGLSADQADEWEKNVSREFALWAENKDCDAARMLNFYQLQQLAFLSALMSGDVFALLPVIPRKNNIYDLRVQLVEADRVCNPYNVLSDDKVLAGIEVGDYGEPVAYHIAKYHPLSLLNQKANTWTKVQAFGTRTGRRNVIHLLEMERPGHRRGNPMLSPVIEALKQLGRYSEAELMAAVISGLFTVAITSESPEGPDIGEDHLPGIVSGTSVEDDVRNDIKLGNGTMIELAPGEKIEPINPGRPNALFDPFVTSILRQIGAALEIPMELLVKHFTASYSASRAALLEAWKFFRRQRDWLSSDFNQPIYEEWLSEAVAKGRVKAPGFFNDLAVRKAYCNAEWNGPTAGQLDPVKEANASKIKVQEGFSTRQRETAELTGGDWNQNYRQRVREERMMREGGLVTVEMAAPQQMNNEVKGGEED
ncbi:phage portal protein [Pelosinus sp. UFO1]|uniref:phage portal protein n=1 Tax=Pelosinus sp. UFO1 TaxID=484770 RepID=UPI0004D13DBB|nr:phage portal protein [Pelosinus sp. UFO1]AIF51248.1 phage portal protein, lambda family [Pelosinus sp. UFO1]